MTQKFTFAIDLPKGIHTQVDNSRLLHNNEHRLTEKDIRDFYTLFRRVIGNAVVKLSIDGYEAVECEVVIPMNITPRAVEAVGALVINSG